MARKDLQIHGRDHAPTGADPIPGLFAPSDCYVEQAAGTSVPAGTSNMPWDVFWRSSSIWSTGPDTSTANNNTSGDDYVHVTESGIYIVHAWVSGLSWASGSINVSTPADVLTTSRYSIGSYPQNNNGEVFLTLMAHANAATWFTLIITNDDGVSRTMYSTMSVARLGSGSTSQVY